jgi:hypothetical protein
LDRSGHGIVEIITLYFPGGPNENHVESISSGLVTEHLSNASLKIKCDIYFIKEIVVYSISNYPYEQQTFALGYMLSFISTMLSPQYEKRK